MFNAKKENLYILSCSCTHLMLCIPFKISNSNIVYEYSLFQCIYAYIYITKTSSITTYIYSVLDNCECAALAKYALHSDDPLTQMVQNAPTPTQKFPLKYASAPKFTTPEIVDANHRKCLCEKPLHGKFFHQQAEIPQVDMEQSHLWLRQAQLRPETEAAICAAQKQTMVTNHIQKEILKQAVDPLCCIGVSSKTFTSPSTLTGRNISLNQQCSSLIRCR